MWMSVCLSQAGWLPRLPGGLKGVEGVDPWGRPALFGTRYDTLFCCIRRYQPALPGSSTVRRVSVILSYAHDESGNGCHLHVRVRGGCAGFGGKVFPRSQKLFPPPKGVSFFRVGREGNPPNPQPGGCISAYPAPLKTAYGTSPATVAR